MSISPFLASCIAKRFALYAALILLGASSRESCAAQLQAETAASYEKYVRLTEQRIDDELRTAASASPFLALDFSSGTRAPKLRESLRRGEIYVDRRRTLEHGRPIEINDGIIHHWIGAVFVPDVKLAALQQWLKDYDRHEQFFPEVEKSQLISRNGEEYTFFYRLRRKKIITVVYNSQHRATYTQITAQRVASRGIATRIAQLTDAATQNEKELPIGNDGGYLWRLNSYWRFEESDGGVYVECETISLSRDIPFGVGWMIRGLVESVPRESLTTTLTSLRAGARKSAGL